MQYYGTRLSENISRRDPEGYLLCLNVPVARSGTQEYLAEELGIEVSGFFHGDLIPVERPEEEVFAEETVASFEGMPVTNDHPRDGVDIENIRRLQAGHAHNIRRGTGKEADLLLADLIITDPRLIEAILAGKREISCGYTYELCEENGRYVQRKIRGNHIAVVDAGRAGPRVAIKDRRAERGQMGKHNQDHERMGNKGMKKGLSKILARMAKDGDVETVAEFISEVLEEREDEASAVETAETVENTAMAVAGAPAAEEPVVVEVPENREITIDEETFSGLLERLDKLIALLTPTAAGGTPAAAEETASAETVTDEEDPAAVAEEISEIVEEALEAMGITEEETAETGGVVTPEAVSEMVQEVLEIPTSTILEEENEEDGECQDPAAAYGKDTLKAVMLAIRPALSGMSRKQRKKVCGDIANRLMLGRERRAGDRSVYAGLYAGAAGRKRETDPRELGRKIMEKRNPNYRK